MAVLVVRGGPVQLLQVLLFQGLEFVLRIEVWIIAELHLLQHLDEEAVSAVGLQILFYIGIPAHGHIKFECYPVERTAQIKPRPKQDPAVLGIDHAKHPRLLRPLLVLTADGRPLRPAIPCATSCLSVHSVPSHLLIRPVSAFAFSSSFSVAFTDARHYIHTTGVG